MTDDAKNMAKSTLSTDRRSEQTDESKIRALKKGNKNQRALSFIH